MNSKFSTKIIVSNKSALQALYGENLDNIGVALDALIASDNKKKINTQVIYLDDQKLMESFNVPYVSDKNNEEQNKEAIDGLYNDLNPDYIMILGGPDIVPFQSMTNPVSGDPDPNVPSDLPYASDSGYSTNINDFLNPSRVVGRLPGISGESNPEALITAIDAAANLTTRTKEEYETYFSVSASVWQGSTTKSLTNIFGNADDLELSPPSGPDWTDKQLESRSHFVNCHGSSDDSKWYGQSGSNYPEAVKASQIDGKLSVGTIAAAECCYGAQLYAPGASQSAICNTYLGNQAAAFCGSTNVAYGPADGQGQADLITQYFIKNLLDGFSSGSAMLKARQKYIDDHGWMGATDLKTIAQFYLLGDPSGLPVGKSSKAPVPKSYFPLGENDRQVLKRRKRRANFIATSVAISLNVAIEEEDDSLAPSEQTHYALEKLMEEEGVKKYNVASSRTVGGEYQMSPFRLKGVNETVHTLSGIQENTQDGLQRFILVIGKELDGKLVSARTLHSKSLWKSQVS